MQERKKSKIVIASVLKPIDDTRMFEKIGLTLASDGHEVHIIGFPVKIKPVHTSIQFHATAAFSRISLKRVLSVYTIYKKWLTLKPDILIITTHELLWFAILTRIFTRTKIVYDIRENYYYNIRYTQAFPSLLRLPVALYVRLKELLTTQFINYFFLAEKNYETELAFLPQRKVVLENKFRKSLVTTTNNSSGYSNLLFTGTLATITGVFETIALTKKLHSIDPTFSLTIVGYAAQAMVLKKIMSEIEHCAYIKLTGGSVLVPHTAIINEILKADYGIVWYPSNKSTSGSMPTKFYEYTALGLPILSPANQPLAKHIQQHIGLLFDTNESTEKLLAKLRKGIERKLPLPAVYWENEEELLKQIINNL